MQTQTVITLTPAELRQLIRDEVQAAMAREQQIDEAQDWPAFISRQELASKLDISPQTVTAWERRGILKGQKTGRIIRYSREAVTSALKQMNR